MPWRVPFNVWALDIWPPSGRQNCISFPLLGPLQWRKCSKLSSMVQLSWPLTLLNLPLLRFLPEQGPLSFESLFNLWYWKCMSGILGINRGDFNTPKGTKEKRWDSFGRYCREKWHHTKACEQKLPEGSCGSFCEPLLPSLFPSTQQKDRTALRSTQTCPPSPSLLRSCWNITFTLIWIPLINRLYPMNQSEWFW